MRKLGFLVPVVVVAIVVALSSIFVVDEREKALVLQFGQIKSVKENRTVRGSYLVAGD